MKRISIRNVCFVLKNYGASAIKRIVKILNWKLLLNQKTKVNSENEIKKIINDKRDEYIQLMMTQSQECIYL